MRSLAAFAGLLENEQVARRYCGLAELPEGALGRTLHQFYQDNHFPLPGEKHGAPEAIIAHDASHVLSGYGTDEEGEIEFLAFQAGYRRGGTMNMLAFILLQLQLGLRFTLLAPAGHHLLDRPGMAERLFLAHARGAAMTVDLLEGWDFWSVAHVPLEGLRRRYNVPPAALAAA